MEESCKKRITQQKKYNKNVNAFSNNNISNSQIKNGKKSIIDSNKSNKRIKKYQQKNGIIKIKILYYYINILFYIGFIIFFLPLSYNKKAISKLRQLNDDSEIKVTIDGEGIQKIIYSGFYLKPYQVEVNGVILDEPNIEVTCTQEEDNIIIMRFNESLNTFNHMFFMMDNIKKVDFSNFDSSQVTDMTFMFSSCKNLEYVNFNNINTSSLILMTQVFEHCVKLTSLDLSCFDISSVIDMSFLMYDCPSLLSINLSNLNSKSLKNMNSLFSGCSSLTSVDLTSFDTSSVETMKNMFKNCKKLTSLNITNFDTISVTEMNDMFNNCTLLTSLELSNFKTSNVKTMENMFRDCSNLLSLNLSNLDTSSVTSMKHMFSYCNELTSLNIENFLTSNVTTMNYMFNECRKLNSLDLSSFNTSKVTDMNYMFYNCEKLNSLNLSNFNGSLVTLVSNMFNGCKELEFLDLSNFKATSATNMQNMFANCESLTSLNLSNFNTTHATGMKYMFYNCKELKTLDISNFYTSSISTLEYMFSGCENLASLDISNFDYSKVSRIDNMLSNCSSLVYLNLGSIENLDKMKNKTDMLSNISSNLKYCTNDILKDYLELSELECNDICFEKNIKLIVEENSCLTSCRNISNYQYEFNNICYNQCPENTHISKNDEFLCEVDLECKHYSNLDKSECYDEVIEGYYLKDEESRILLKCHEDCKTCDKKETINNTNCNSCLNEKYLYFGICLDFCENFEYDINNNKICKCPEKCKECSLESLNTNNLCISCNDGYYPKLNDNSNNQDFINCYTGEIEGYYLNLTDSIYKPCYQSCKTCDKEGNQKENNCLECKPNYSVREDFINDNNCYEICNYYYYFDQFNNYQCTTKAECPEEQKNLISNKNQCIDECKNDDIYRNEYNNECYINCPEGTSSNNFICINQTEETETTEETKTTETTETTKATEKTEASTLNCSAEELFLSQSCGTEISSPSNKDKLIENIQNDIMNHKIDTLLDNITKSKQDLVVKEEDTIFQITTTDNQKNNKYHNMSTVNLGDCEDRLKDIYKIDKSLPLIIFKIDYYSPGLLIPIIGYEIFHPLNKSKLDLNYCKDILVELNIPVSIDEDNLFKHDPNSEYYTDECVPSTSDNGTDILLNDRQNEYNSNNLSLCQNNCTFTGYETDTKKAICDCEVKTKINLISEIIDDKNKLSSNFTDTDSSGSSNVVTMKCVYTVFTKEGLQSNIGSYILIIVILLFAISSILFYKVGYVMLENSINSILHDKGKKINEVQKENIYKFEHKISNKKKKKNIKNSKKSCKKSSSKKSSKKKLKDCDYPPKKKRTEKFTKTNKPNDISQSSKLKLKDIKIMFNFQKRKGGKNKSAKISNKIKGDKQIAMHFNDFELNSFTYQEALKYDRREYMEYYKSLLKTKHPIIFGFVPVNDYNTMIVKVCLFFLSFCIYYAINAVFITDSTIHKIYEDGGSYNLLYSLPQIIYSFVIAHIITIILKFAFLSERNIIQIKKEDSLDSAKNLVDKVKRTIIIKYIIFFVAGIIFLIFFWYYLSSFGAVFQNSQVYLIKNTLMSFLIAIIYPFVINLLSGCFRMPSLKNNNKECLYKTSKIIQII